MKTFIITRDRPTYTLKCLESILRYPQLEPVFLDHGSTLPDMLDLLSSLHGYTRLHYGDRLPREAWDHAIPENVGKGEYYAVTDCDIELSDNLHPEWLDAMHEMFALFPKLTKTGFALRIDDLPDTQLGRRVREWESQFWANPIGEFTYHAPIDTTFAVYRPLDEQREFTLGPAVRFAGRGTARHLPWYETGPENYQNRWYREHALQGATNWSSPETYP